MTTSARRLMEPTETPLGDVLDAAVTTAMNTLGQRHGCGPLRWCLRDVDSGQHGVVSGFPSSIAYNEADGPGIVQRWASALGLPERADEVAGFRSWVGVVDSCLVEVWCRLPDPTSPVWGGR